MRYSLVVALCWWAIIVQAETIAGRVVGVADGDTVTLLDADHQQHKIRLMGIDAPESRQAFGQASKHSLSDLIFQHEVIAECGKTDRYRRKVCKIVLDGRDINLEQVKSGMAWHYRQYAKEQSVEDRESYAAAENNARRQRIGLWSDVEPVPPWAWRRR